MMQMTSWRPSLLRAILILVIGVSGVAASAQTPSSTSPCMVRNPMLQGGYLGECQGGWAHGQGRATGRDRYEGSFRNGHASGPGVYTWSNGQRFEGEFLDGRVSGHARFHYQNGDILDGIFRDNQLSGIGQLQRRGGETASVELRDGVLVIVGAGVVAPPSTTGAPTAPTPVPPPSSGGNATAAPTWTPQLDFEDLFPSYLIATATRKLPEGTKSIARSRGEDPLSSADSSGLLDGLGVARPTSGATARRLDSTRQETYLGDPWGLIGIRIQSTEPGTQVRLKVAIDDIAEPTEAEFTLPSAGAYAIYPQIRYRYDRLLAATQIKPVNVTWSVAINGQPPVTRNTVTRVRALRDAPFLVANHRGTEYLGWVFTSFVTEDAPWIDTLIAEAFADHATGALGYQVPPAGVDRQVEAVFNHLKKRGVKYSSITTAAGSSDKVLSQVVRLPSDSVRSSQANCIDGTVLIASVLRKMGIRSFIVLGPGHAMLGYLRAVPKKGETPDFRVLETTAISQLAFNQALAAGAGTFKEWSNGNKPEFQIISVDWARAQGITPIAQ